MFVCLHDLISFICLYFYFSFNWFILSSFWYIDNSNIYFQRNTWRLKCLIFHMKNDFNTVCDSGHSQLKCLFVVFFYVWPVLKRHIQYGFRSIGVMQKRMYQLVTAQLVQKLILLLQFLWYCFSFNRTNFWKRNIHPVKTVVHPTERTFLTNDM